MAAEVHVTDYGTVFEPTMLDENGVVVDISVATTKTIFFRKPSGAVLTKTAVLSNTGTDGKMRYVAIVGDLDEVGVWGAQAFVILPGGAWHAQKFEFEVFGNYA